MIEIKNEDIKLQMNGSLVESIKFKNIEILNTTKKWKKKLPILFPAIGDKKIFNINNEEYQIPRHGFWNDINFKIQNNKNQIRLMGNGNNKNFPFNTPIEQYINLNKNKISFITKINGPKIPFQFGYHPAFNYDLGNIKYKGKAILYYLNGKIESKKINIQNIKDLDWDNVDSFILKTKSIKLENKKYCVELKTNLKYITLWTNGDKFICLEPFSNLPENVMKNDNSKIKNQKLKMDIVIIKKEL